MRISIAEQRYFELHRILAGCFESGDFVPYEIAIKAECSQVTDAIAKVYAQRIAKLLLPFFFKIKSYLKRIEL